MTTTLKALTLLPLAAVPGQAQAAAHARPAAPTLIEPADRAPCFAPDPDRGIRFTWRINGPEPGGEEYPIASYIDIRHWEGERAGWQRWLGTYANPPFTMIVRPRVFDADFAWRVWAVDPSGEAKPYATPSPWRLFCTLPANESPPSGSSRPSR